MAAHSFTVTSTLTPADAYTRLIDLERVPEWDHGVSASKLIGGAGPAVGAQYEVTVAGFDGQPTPVIYEITEADEPRRFVMVGQNEVFRAADTLSLTGTDGGCELRYDGTLDLLGDDPLMTPTQLDSVFPKIAAVAEAGLTTFLNPTTD